MTRDEIIADVDLLLSREGENPGILLFRVDETKCLMAGVGSDLDLLMIAWNIMQALTAKGMELVAPVEILLHAIITNEMDQVEIRKKMN